MKGKKVVVRSKREREGYPTRYNSIIVIISGVQRGGGTALLKNWHYFHHRHRRLPRTPGHDDCIESRRFNRYDDDVIVISWL